MPELVTPDFVKPKCQSQGAADAENIRAVLKRERIGDEQRSVVISMLVNYLRHLTCALLEQLARTHGAKIFPLWKDGSPLLRLACANRHTEVVKLLIIYGANIEVPILKPCRVAVALLRLVL